MRVNFFLQHFENIYTGIHSYYKVEIAIHAVKYNYLKGQTFNEQLGVQFAKRAKKELKLDTEISRSKTVTSPGKAGSL